MKKISSVLIIASVTEISTANYLITAFRKAGCRLFVCSDVASDKVDLLVSGVVDVGDVCKKFSVNPDLILFVEGGTMRVLPVAMDKVNSISAWYGIDTHMDYEKHLKIGRLFDISFIAQKQYVEKLKEDGIKQVSWLPLAFATELLNSLPIEKTIDISYVGSNNPTVHQLRHKIIEELKHNFPSSFFGMANPILMEEIYSKSYLVFNKSINNDVNMRFFESLGAGTVLVTDLILDNGLEEVFLEGQHYFVYKDPAEIVSLITNLLTNKKLLQRLGKSARNYVLKNHTYDNRISSMSEIVIKANKTKSSSSENYFSACLALGLYGDALFYLSKAFKFSSKIGIRGFLSKSISYLLVTISKIIKMIESILISAPKIKQKFLIK